MTGTALAAPLLVASAVLGVVAFVRRSRGIGLLAGASLLAFLVLMEMLVMMATRP
jgi:hypothetical protein